MCCTEKTGPRPRLPKERGWKTHFESISLSPGNIRPRQGRKIRKPGPVKLSGIHPDKHTRCNNTTQHQALTRCDKLPLAPRFTKPRHGKHQARPETRATAQNTHCILLKSSNQPMAAVRRRQGQQLYSWHGPPSRSPQPARQFPLAVVSEATQPQPPALPPEAWPWNAGGDSAERPACSGGIRVSRAKWQMLKKCSHENPIAERTEARLLYLTQTGRH